MGARTWPNLLSALLAGHELDVPDTAWAMGEIMAGNVLGKGYLAGIGMAIGTTFGRIAGEEAARHVRG